MEVKCAVLQYDDCDKRLNDMYNFIDDKQEEIAHLEKKVADLKNEVKRLKTRANSDDLHDFFSNGDLPGIEKQVQRYFIERYEIAAKSVLAGIDKDDWRAHIALLEPDRFENAANARDAFKALCKMMHPDKTTNAPTLERARLTAHFTILEPVLKDAKNKER